VGGHVIMGKLGNETIKAELGRSTWKLLHTMTARFPLEPTIEERTALKQWITLLSRLYPCGECAEHFQVLLKQYPPQTSSRDAASQWACSVHNKVNERLEKPMFDCSLVADMYQCGCDEE
ncbi:ERV/ALR sulfhydryl oxidase domain-containing protein, partial [Umbelopsis sp. AD052]